MLTEANLASADGADELVSIIGGINAEAGACGGVPEMATRATLLKESGPEVAS